MSSWQDVTLCFAPRLQKAFCPVMAAFLPTYECLKLIPTRYTPIADNCMESNRKLKSHLFQTLKPLHILLPHIRRQ